MRQFGPYDTQWLTRASFAPTAGPRLRKRVLLVVATLAAVSIVAMRSSYLDRHMTSPAGLAEVQRDNAALAAEVEHTRMELEMERATRTELQRQAEALSARVAELNQQLEFLTSRSVPAGRASGPATVARE